MFRGVVYIATSPRHLEEAKKSAASVKGRIPDMPVMIFSSEQVADPCFERVGIVSNPVRGYIDKVFWMAKSPFMRTLFLDTDTYVCADISEIFTLLDRFDLAAAHASNRLSRRSDGMKYGINDIPEAFPEMNTGVILFRKSRAIKQFFRNWLIYYRQDLRLSGAPRHDQPAFRRALYRSSLNVATLPPEYNCRFNFPAFVSCSVKILHGRHPEIAQIAQAINERTDRRLFMPSVGLITAR